MDRRNENPPITCRYLKHEDFSRVHETFLEAFSDYLITFQLTREQLERHILLTAVDLDLSVGCFEGEKMVGFTLNGFGMWGGKSTIYDAGTGVIPDFRRQGLSRAMFDLLFPMCAERNIKQCLLEVITTNDRAVKLYEQLGFYPTRTLMLLECKGPVRAALRENEKDIEIREITQPYWGVFKTFWDGDTSWQNSVEAIERSLDLKTILGAFIGKDCVGYVVFSANLGRVAQMAVSKGHRNQGIGSKLLLAMEAASKDAESLQIINIDDSLTDAVRFLYNRGFGELLSQYEMVKPL
jgi:ribosomal protein S18 acetylase RimI-like enzyme